MPAQPRWISNLDRIIPDLEAIPDQWLDRQMVQDLLGVKARRAQQIVASCIIRVVGTSALVDREAFLQQLKRIKAGEAGSYEQKRRQRVAQLIQRLGHQRVSNPVLNVEAPTPIVSQSLDNLPPGVHLGKGQITIRFADPREALEKLLALAMAVGNDYEQFEAITSTSTGDR